MVFAFVDLADLIPLFVFAGIVLAIWAVLSMISQRNSRAQERLARISRPQSLADIEDPKLTKKDRFQGLADTAKALSGPLMPQTELEQSALKVKLANAGFRSDSAAAVYLGLRFASLLVFTLGSVLIALPKYGFTLSGLTCSGDNVLGPLISGIIRPGLKKHEGQTRPLVKFPLGTMHLRDAQISTVNETVKLTATFGS